MAKAALSIDVISDVVCPWCYIGKRRLEGALRLYREQHPGSPAPEVRWWSFQLNPDMPAAGIDRGTYLEQKFGTANMAVIYARVAAACREVGIPFAFDRVVRQPNTLVAHSLVALAGLHGMLEAVFRAYFIGGEDLTQEDALLRIAVGAGLAEAAVRECLADPEMRAQTAHGGRARPRAWRGGRTTLHLQPPHRGI
ncbi:MAG: DsbA family oxidoreductase [Betaproteobacteria bacterium]|nr:DsbA family oxidoreductase [Betaproteobacteria bacterium]